MCFSLVARKLGEFVWQMAASPAYLAKRGMPKTPAELARHDCLYYRNGKVATNRWHFSGPGLPQQIKVSGPLAINDAGVLVDAACAGMGIVMVNESLLAQPLADGRLQAVLPEYEPAPGFPVYAVYPAREWLPAKTVAFVDYLIEHLSP